jgi:hypothetical protein
VKKRTAGEQAGRKVGQVRRRGGFLTNVKGSDPFTRVTEARAVALEEAASLSSLYRSLSCFLQSRSYRSPRRYLFAIVRKMFGPSGNAAGFSRSDREKDCALARFWTNRPAAAINRGQISAMKGLKKYNNYGHPQLYYECRHRL